VGVFLTALFIEEALEFSAFPAIVLVATLLRLSLNVATTGNPVSLKTTNFLNEGTAIER
jgi:flagellar biosynthesis component FlhA